MNCEAAAIDRALTLIEGFVGGSRREAVICGSEEWSYSIGNQKSLNEAPKALVYRFEDILSIAGVDGGIDLLKCDIEGAEREVFAECTGWLDRINNLFVELHPPYRERDFLADLRRQGAELQVVSRSKTETCPVLLLTREQPQRFATT